MAQRYVFIALYGFLGSQVLAQNHAILDINNIHARFQSTGSIGYDPNSSAMGFEVPAGESTHALYAAGLWLGGMDPLGGLHFAAAMSGPLNMVDYHPGPLTTTGAATIDQATSTLYDHVWKIDHADAVRHSAYFDCLETPGCNVGIMFPGYTIPADFLSWPAMGDPAADQALYLAPFVDRDQDGVYDPANGDYPCIAGDQALYSIFNDNLGAHLTSGGAPLGVEIHMMPFALNNGTNALHETIFVYFRIINRSSTTYSNVRIGMFNDFDLGCSNDDYLGTNPKHNLTYALNADNFDEGCFGQAGYGIKPPVLGATILKGITLDPNGLDDPLANALPAWNGMGFDDTFIDNERSGLAYAKHFYREGGSEPEYEDPGGATSHFYNVIQGNWRDGLIQSYGGTGRSLAPDAVPARYACPGESDPQSVGTGGQVMPPWYMSGLGTPPTDPRIVSSMEAVTLTAGAEKDFLMAYVYARSPTSSPTTSVEDLQNRVDSVRNFTLTNPDIFPPNSVCTIPSTVGMPDRTMARAALSIFPVPASDNIVVRTIGLVASTPIAITDAQGKLVLQQQLSGSSTTIDISALPPGIYSIHAVDTRTPLVGRFVKE